MKVALLARRVQARTFTPELHGSMAKVAPAGHFEQARRDRRALLGTGAGA